MSIVVATDFSGLGSPEEALKRLQVEHTIAFACDKDKYAKASYLANHKPGVFYDDIVERNHAEAPGSDLYVFGFPCQAFSLAGNRKGFEDTRGTLVYNSAEYIRTHRPRVFTGENVKGLLSHDKIKGSKSKYGRTFGVIRDLFGTTVNGQQNLYKYDDCLNYHIFFQVLNTKEYGIPQNRERIFIVGFRDEADALKFRFPKKIHLELKLKDLLQDNANSKYFLSDVDIMRLKRRENYVPQINCEITGTLNTKNNSGQLQFDKGTTLIYDVPEKYYLTDKMLEGFIEKINGGQVGFINQETQSSKVFDTDIEYPTLQSGTHGYVNGYIKVKEATRLGFDIAEEGDSINLSLPTSTTRRGRVGKGQANTLDTQCNQAVVVNELITVYKSETKRQGERIYSPEGISQCLSDNSTQNGITGLYQTGMRIRRLTPRECFRLQGYSDYFFEKCASINSDTQLYKQAGNSITVDTIMHLLIQILKAIDVPYKLAA